MKANGTIDINDNSNGPENLVNPTATIVDVLVEVLFEDENGDKHSRFIKLGSNVSNLNNIRIDDDIKNHSMLKKFK